MAITETLDSRKCISLNVINLKNKIQVSIQYYCFPWALELGAVAQMREGNSRFRSGLKGGLPLVPGPQH